jgi:hypothetical protein
LTRTNLWAQESTGAICIVSRRSQSLDS